MDMSPQSETPLPATDELKVIQIQKLDPIQNLSTVGDRLHGVWSMVPKNFQEFQDKTSDPGPDMYDQTPLCASTTFGKGQDGGKRKSPVIDDPKSPVSENPVDFMNPGKPADRSSQDFNPRSPNTGFNECEHVHDERTPVNDNMNLDGVDKVNEVIDSNESTDAYDEVDLVIHPLSDNEFDIVVIAIEAVDMNRY